MKYNTLQHTATHCNTLQHTATHCNTLQPPATPRNTLQQHTATHSPHNLYAQDKPTDDFLEKFKEQVLELEKHQDMNTWYTRPVHKSTVKCPEGYHIEGIGVDVCVHVRHTYTSRRLFVCDTTLELVL